MQDSDKHEYLLNSCYPCSGDSFCDRVVIDGKHSQRPLQTDIPWKYQRNNNGALKRALRDVVVKIENDRGVERSVCTTKIRRLGQVCLDEFCAPTTGKRGRTECNENY